MPSRRTLTCRRCGGGAPLVLVSLDAWLGVLPQLIARIHTREPTVRHHIRPRINHPLSHPSHKPPTPLVYGLTL